MGANEKHYPRKGNIPMPMVYSTLNRFGEPEHTLYGGKLDMGGCRTGAGSWWPDFGPTVRDFSPGGIHHPTEFVFQHAVVPFTNSMQRSASSPASPTDRPAVNQAVLDAHHRPTQFRHPAPQTEALYKSVNIMPYKCAGRRKCGEASNWRAALSSGAEGCKHGGRMPIWCKGPLLDNPDWHQRHPLKRDEDDHNIHSTCVKEQLAAGGATGTSPVDGLLLSNKSTKALGIRDTDTIRAEMTISGSRDLSHSATFKAANTRLNGHIESFTPSASRANLSMTSVGSTSSLGGLAEKQEKLPNWIATKTMGSRDTGAAGGQAGPTSIRRIPVKRTA